MQDMILQAMVIVIYCLTKWSLSFKDDIERAKKVLEDIIGRSIYRFRTAGFGIKDDAKWAFDIIAEVGYNYDSSIFPAANGHGRL